MRTRILMSFKKFNDSQKDGSCAVSHTWKKTVANDIAWIKHLTLKFRGPVGLEGMNKRWKNELLREHWPKSWMCSSHVGMVCYCCWYRQEGSVKKRVGQFCSKNMWGREDERMLHRLLYCPGKSSGQNGMNHSHWMKCINWNPDGKMIPALNNNLKFFLSVTSSSMSGYVLFCELIAAESMNK